MRERLFRNQHIRLSSEFLRFRSGGVFEFYGLLFVLKILDASCGVSRLGIIVTKKIGNAVVRNRVRRVIREVFRRKLQKLDQSYDYLVIAKRMIVGVPHRKVELELLNAAETVHGRRMRSGT